MDVQELIGQLRQTVEGARSMPMSSSAVINRSEVLELVGQIESALPRALAHSDRVYSERDTVVAEGRSEAERIVGDARLERDRLVSDTELYRLAKADIDKRRTECERECEALRRETDDYVDGRLANLEISLTKTLEAVSRGRDRLQGRSELGRLAEAGHGDEGPVFPLGAD